MLRALLLVAAGQQDGVEWRYGAPGASCTATCANWSQSCLPNLTVSNRQAMNSVVGALVVSGGGGPQCNTTTRQPKPTDPGYYEGTCYFQNGGDAPINCSASVAGSGRRFCPCACAPNTGPHCEKLCPASPPAQHVTACHRNVAHEVCRATCAPGYNNVSGSGRFVCGNAGRWKSPTVSGSISPSLRCERVHCPAFTPRIPHAEPCPMSEPGQQCPAAGQPGCDAGFVPSSHKTPFTCGLDGQ